MKKLIACTLIGAMLCGMTVSAAGSPSAATVSGNSSSSSSASTAVAVEASGVSATVEAAAAAENKSVSIPTMQLLRLPDSRMHFRQDRVDTLSLTEPPVM